MSPNEHWTYFVCRYLLHSADLSFLEGVSQTLTSAQVGIKSEVARSNGQAREIFQNIDKITATIKQVQAKVHSLSSVPHIPLAHNIIASLVPRSSCVFQCIMCQNDKENKISISFVNVFVVQGTGIARVQLQITSSDPTVKFIMSYYLEGAKAPPPPGSALVMKLLLRATLKSWEWPGDEEKLGVAQR